MGAHGVRALLMGGQACVFYGAAEFSRDADFVILADAQNLARLRQVLSELRAEPIAVPPFELKFLRKGHAVRAKQSKIDTTACAETPASSFCAGQANQRIKRGAGWRRIGGTR